MNDQTRCDIYRVRDRAIFGDFAGYLVTRPGDINALVAFIVDPDHDDSDNGIKVAVAVARDPDGDWHRTRRTTPEWYDKDWLPDVRKWDTDPVYVIDLRDGTQPVPGILFGAQAEAVDDEDNTTGPLFVLHPFCPVMLKRLERQRKVLLALAEEPAVAR